MKAIIRAVLRKTGLLKPLRKMVYKMDNRKWVNKFNGQDIYTMNYHSLTAKFSLRDPFSAHFFGLYFNNGVYEAEGLDTLLAQVGKNGIVFDVGANIGYFTCVSALYCSEGQVYAFELGGENFKILKKNIEINGLRNVTTELCAVSDKSGVVHIQDSAVANAVLKILENTEGGGDIISVPSISLDDYCKTKNIRPDIIKIDVEGAEMKVLQGMVTLMKGNCKLLIEIHEKELKQFHSSKEEVINFITASGFEMKIIGNDVKKNILVFAWK